MLDNKFKAVDKEAEPCNLEATLETLAAEIEAWEAVVSYYSKTYDNDDDYDYDIFTRYWLHGILNGLNAAKIDVPEALMTKLSRADEQFMHITCPSQFVGRGYNICDETAFWYYYRLPITL